MVNHFGECASEQKDYSRTSKSSGITNELLQPSNYSKIYENDPR